MADGSRHIMYSVAEATYGASPVNPALDVLRITGCTIGLVKDPLVSDELRDDRQISDFRLGANQVLGDINFELSFASFDQFLKAALLSVDWDADEPQVGTDQIKAGTLRESFTFVRHFADLQSGDNPFYIYRGCEITALSFTVAANAMVTGVMSVIGQSQEISSDLTVLGTPTYPAASTTSPLDSFTGTLNEGGSAIAVITEITLDLQNNFEPRWLVGSKDTALPSVRKSDLKGSITAYFENSTLVEKFINETASDVDFTLPDGAGNELKFIIPRLFYTGGKPDVPDDGPVTLSMPYQAVRDDTYASNYVIERTPV